MQVSYQDSTGGLERNVHRLALILGWMIACTGIFLLLAFIFHATSSSDTSAFGHFSADTSPLNQSDIAAQLRSSIDFIPEFAASLAMATFSLTQISAKTLLIGFHLIGLVLGFGSAVFLDLYLIRFFWKQKVGGHTLEIARFGSKVVSAGLAILWLSGLGLLVLYGLETPEKLANPKIWAKVTIVSVLTVNGVLIHRFVIERLEQKIGQFILQRESSDVKSILFISAAVSFFSWGSAMILGTAKELNYLVPAQNLLALYLAGVIASYFVLKLVVAILSRKDKGRQFSEFKPIIPAAASHSL